MFSLILNSKSFKLSEDGVLVKCELLENRMKAAGFSVSRSSYPTHMFVVATSEFDETLTFPNLFALLGDIDVRQLENIKLETDATYWKANLRLRYRHPESLFDIYESRDTDCGSRRGSQRMYLMLSDFKHQMGEDGRVWGEAITKFQEMATLMLEEIANHKWASQIIALVDDLKSGRNNGALAGIVKKAEAIKAVSRHEHYFPQIKKVKDGAIAVDQTKPISEELIDQVVEEVQSALGVKYLGRVRVETPQFKLWPSDYQPDKWPDASEQQRHTYLYFALPGWQVTAEVRLRERNNALHSAHPDWEWSHRWGASFHAIMPFTTPGLGFAGSDVYDSELLHLEAHHTSWKEPYLGSRQGMVCSQPIHTQDYATSGDYHAAFVEFEAGETWELNKLGWDFMSAFMNLLKRCWWGSNLLRFALPGKLMSVQEMFSEPAARFELMDCMDYFWQQFPLHTLLEYCEDKEKCVAEFMDKARRDDNENYREHIRMFRNMKC